MYCDSMRSARACDDAVNMSHAFATVLHMLAHHHAHSYAGTSHLGRKDRLSAALSRSRRLHSTDYDFYPETYILPHDYTHWASKAAGGMKTQLWIAKPHASSCGRG